MANKYLMPNPTDNWWINKYNTKVQELSDQQAVKGVTGIHHILPRSDYPELAADPRNKINASFQDHMDLHYYMWKYNPRYSAQLWFGCVYGRKHKMWDLPGGESEYQQLKNDLRVARQYRKETKSNDI